MAEYRTMNFSPARPSLRPSCVVKRLSLLQNLHIGIATSAAQSLKNHCVTRNNEFGASAGAADTSSRQNCRDDALNVAYIHEDFS